MTMAKKRKRRTDRTNSIRFLPERSTKDREIREAYFKNHVSTSVSGGATLREVVTRIASAASNPVAIESLPNELETVKLPRSVVGFGYLGNLLDEIAKNFLNMRWWITKRGLNMAVVPPGAMLPVFDLLAGSLCAKYRKNGRLSKTDLGTIAKELDAKASEMEGSFLDRFEPAARKRIAEFNQKYAGNAIKTFEKAIAYRWSIRLVRKRLCRAYERLRKEREAGL
jgi:hypothetical protein